MTPLGQRTLTIKPDGTMHYTPYPYHEEEIVPSDNLLSNPGFETTADWVSGTFNPLSGDRHLPEHRRDC